jgi:hypothetical protein
MSALESLAPTIKRSWRGARSVKLSKKAVSSDGLEAFYWRKLFREEKGSGSLGLTWLSWLAWRVVHVFMRLHPLIVESFMCWYDVLLHCAIVGMSKRRYAAEANYTVPEWLHEFTTLIVDASLAHEQAKMKAKNVEKTKDPEQKWKVCLPPWDWNQ